MLVSRFSDKLMCSVGLTLLLLTRLDESAHFLLSFSCCTQFRGNSSILQLGFLSWLISLYEFGEPSP